jgi:RNA polymerase sigma-70 factor (ECF subfamily)
MDGDNNLIPRAVDGDRQAFAELYDRYSRPVFLTLVGLLRTREDAEDALQAAFLTAWRKLPTLRRPDRFVSWLFRIARNKARDAARRQRERPGTEMVGEDLVCPGDGASETEELERLVASLRPETRALVLLIAVEGWTAEDAALAVGRSASTVRRRYARALRHLRDRLTDGDDDE